jgi:SAM-dependent methyltransferase
VRSGYLMRPEQREWEELAELDPLWAVLSEPERKGGRWELEAFLATGEQEVARMVGRMGEFGLPEGRERALDFGCGVGRATRALASRFGEVIGLDASRKMIEHARRINLDVPNASFRVGSPDELEPSSFDLVWSVLVLQHLAPDEIEPALGTLVRLLRPGGAAVFQLPHASRPLHRLQLSRRAYRLLRALGLSAETLHRRTPLTPMRMTVLSRERVEAVVCWSGGHLVAADPYEESDVPTPSTVYVAAR